MPAADIEYGKLLQSALRTVVREVLVRTQAEGLPGEHHFYISLRLDHPGTEAPPFVRQRHAEEMTIVLQNQFWDLAVEDAGFAVTLRFDGMPARLRVPWEAVVAFFDPAAEFGLRFDLPGLAAAGAGTAGPTPVPAAAEAPAAKDDEEPPASDGGEAKVLSFGRPRERRDRDPDGE